MKCKLFVFLKIASVYALVDFKTLEINICRSEENRFYVMEGKTIEQCVDECRARKHCESLNYRTKINLCELFSTTYPDSFSHGDCIYADKRNLQPFQNHCKYGEVQKTTGCVIKECVNMTIPENGRVLGNMMNVGAKIRYICENGYKLKDNRYTSVAECLNTGHWSNSAECVLVSVTNTGTIWSDWSSCNVSCGGGIRSRNRSCTIPTLNSNDVQCSQDDPDFESVTCNLETCQVTYTWTTWTEWTLCSVSCDGGQRTRTRSCTIPTQNGNDVQCSKDSQGIERETCKSQTCQVPTIGNYCMDDTDCVETNGTCIEGRCFCNHLYRYNVTLQNCIKACDSMTNEFEEFPGSAIHMYNDLLQWETVDSTENCKNKCVDNKSCLSFEVVHVNSIFCNLAIVSRDMMLDAFPENIKEYGGATLYTRKCS